MFLLISILITLHMTSSEGPPPPMAAPQWAELLEKEFDKAFVALDLLLGEVDSDQVGIYR